nr:helix-turn-helix domain-containing protein [Fodinicola feengrottensis]
MPEAAPATTEEQIVRAAVRLFAERGFHATGIRQLAEQAGINSSTLYHYMGTKEDLLFRIVQDSSKRLIEAARQLTARELDPPAAICGLVQIHVWSHATYSAETDPSSTTSCARSTSPGARRPYGCVTGTRHSGRRPSRLAVRAAISAYPTVGSRVWASCKCVPVLRSGIRRPESCRSATWSRRTRRWLGGALGASRDRDQVRTLLLLEADAQPIADRVWSQP